MDFPTEEQKPLFLYIDTNVIQDTFRNRRPTSTYLLEHIREKGIRACTSSFTLLELMDVETEHTHIWRRIKQGWTFDDILRKRYPRELTLSELDESYQTIYDKFYARFIKTKIINLFSLEPDGWDYAFESMGDYNLSKGDAIHVATAKFAGCNMFVSNDTDLVELLKANKIILAATPTALKETLQGSNIDSSIL